MPVVNVALRVYKYHMAPYRSATRVHDPKIVSGCTSRKSPQSHGRGKLGRGIRVFWDHRGATAKSLPPATAMQTDRRVDESRPEAAVLTPSRIGPSPHRSDRVQPGQSDAQCIVLCLGFGSITRSASTPLVLVLRAQPRSDLAFGATEGPKSGERVNDPRGVAENVNSG